MDEDIYLIVGELAAIALVGVLIFGAVFAITNSDTVVRKVHAKNIGLMINTLVGLPGDALVKYPDDVSDFSFVLTTKGVSVFKEGEPDCSLVTSSCEVEYFDLPESYKAEGTLLSKEKLCLQKTEQNIILRGCP